MPRTQSREPVSFLAIFFFSPRIIIPIKTVDRRYAVSRLVFTIEMLPFFRLKKRSQTPIAILILESNRLNLYLLNICLISRVVFGINKRMTDAVRLNINIREKISK